MSVKWRWPFGRFKGVLITRTPVGYLHWAANHIPELAAKATEELTRRQVVQHNVELSVHSINRASQRLLHLWQSENSGEGIYNWLLTKSEAALDSVPQGPFENNIRVPHNGIVYIFDMRFVLPVLATVYIEGQESGDKKEEGDGIKHPA